VTLKNAPTNDMRYPKKGTLKATITVLITRAVLTNILVTLLFLYVLGSNSFKAFVIGVAIKANLEIGFTKVVYMAILELILFIGKFGIEQVPTILF
jgi:hypothetical protein